MSISQKWMMYSLSMINMSYTMLDLHNLTQCLVCGTEWIEKILQVLEEPNYEYTDRKA